MMQLKKHYRSTYRFLFDSTGKFFARIAGSVFVYQWSDNKLIKKFSAPLYPCDLSFSVRNEFIAIISTQGKIIIYRFCDGIEIWNSYEQEFQDGKLVFTDDDQLLVCGFGKIVRLDWEKQTKEIILQDNKYNFQQIIKMNRNYYFVSQSAVFILDSSFNLLKIPVLSNGLSTFDLSTKYFVFSEQFIRKTNPPIPFLQKKQPFLQEQKSVLKTVFSSEISVSENHITRFIILELKNNQMVPIVSLYTDVEIKLSVLSSSSDILCLCFNQTDVDELIVYNIEKDKILFRKEIPYLCSATYSPDNAHLLLGTWESGYIYQLV